MKNHHDQYPSRCSIHFTNFHSMVLTYVVEAIAALGQPVNDRMKPDGNAATLHLTASKQFAKMLVVLMVDAATFYTLNCISSLDNFPDAP